MITERVYMTVLGRSAWALLNSYYAVAREKGYYPDVVCIGVEPPLRKEEGTVVEGIRIISERFGFSPRIECTPVDPSDMLDGCRKARTLIAEKKREHARVAIDITPGTKGTVAGILLSLGIENVDHVFFLEISTPYYAAEPLPAIPKQFYRLHDFKELAARARNVR